MEHVGETRGRNVHPASSLDAALPEAGLFVGAEGEERRWRCEAERGGAAPPLGAGDAEAWPVVRVHVELAARPLPLLCLRLLLLAAAGVVICGDERRIKIESIGRSAGTAAEANSDGGGFGPGSVPGAGWTLVASAAFLWWCAVAFLETPPVGLVVAAAAVACVFC
jgi:hypothetical protein